jgi:hypothetical protein
MGRSLVRARWRKGWRRRRRAASPGLLRCRHRVQGAAAGHRPKGATRGAMRAQASATPAMARSMIPTVSPAGSTKIQRPLLRPALTVARPALEQGLVQALGEQRLVLLVAPGGCGKTALLARALDQLPVGHGVAWVALDAGDDLHRLLQCLWQALEPFDLPWRTSPEALAHMAASDEPRVATAGRGRDAACAGGLRAGAWRDRARRPAPCRRRRGHGIRRRPSGTPARALDAGRHHAPAAGACGWRGCVPAGC